MSFSFNKRNQRKARETSLSSLPVSSNIFGVLKKKTRKPEKPFHFYCKRGRERPRYSVLTYMNKQRMKTRKKEEKYRKQRVKQPTKQKKIENLNAKFSESLVEKVLERYKKYGYELEHNNRSYFLNDPLAQTELSKIKRKIPPTFKKKKEIVKKQNEYNMQKHFDELLYNPNYFKNW